MTLRTSCIVTMMALLMAGASLTPALAQGRWGDEAADAAARRAENAAMRKAQADADAKYAEEMKAQKEAKAAQAAAPAAPVEAAPTPAAPAPGTPAATPVTPLAQ